MNICILGWYGTETLGDRAILDGIIKICNRELSINNVFLGSLYPFFSERTLFEDHEILHDGFSGKITIFPENDINELKKNIDNSDLVIMGGGPLSDSKELYLIKSGFDYAKQRDRIRLVFGCGYGPFNNTAMHKIARSIISMSSLSIFRDELSLRRALIDFPGINACHLADPAIISILYYKNKFKTNLTRDEIAVNFRSYYSGMTSNTNLSSSLYELLVKLSCEFNRIRLIPMHTFFHGGDDRRLFSDLLINNGAVPTNIEVQYKPQNLYQMYDSFACAYGCVGMRYHSIVIQTILNGNNVIIDYTRPNEGKTSGFINDLPNGSFYGSRYFNIVDGEIDNELCIKMLKNNEKYVFKDQIDMIIDQYTTLLKVF